MSSILKRWLKRKTALDNEAKTMEQKPVPLCTGKCDYTCKAQCCLNCAFMRDRILKKSVGEVSDPWVDTETHTKRMYAPFDLVVFHCNYELQTSKSRNVHKCKVGKPVEPCVAWEPRFVVDAVSGKVTLIIK